MFTLAHASLCPGNAEEEKSRVGEGSLCFWRRRRGSDIPPTANGDWSDCNICSRTGASVASFHSQIRPNVARLAKLEVKLKHGFALTLAKKTILPQELQE